MHQSLESLAELGWRIKENLTLTVPDFIMKRYGVLPKNWLERFGCIELCVAPDEQSWFITPRDMHGASDSAYAWNEAEKQSLEAAQDDTDWVAEISEYWDAHFPVMFSVQNGYETWVLCLSGSDAGKIKQSQEPEYEEGTVVADSLEEFIGMVAQQVASADIGADAPSRLS